MTTGEFEPQDGEVETQEDRLQAIADYLTAARNHEFLEVRALSAELNRIYTGEHVPFEIDEEQKMLDAQDDPEMRTGIGKLKRKIIELRYCVSAHSLPIHIAIGAQTGPETTLPSRNEAWAICNATLDSLDGVRAPASNTTMFKKILKKQYKAMLEDGKYFEAHLAAQLLLDFDLTSSVAHVHRENKIHRCMVEHVCSTGGQQANSSTID